jgi:hypothetical protein
VHRQALEGGRGVDPDRAAVTHQWRQLGRDPVLGSDVAAEPLGERLRADGDGAPADPLDDALLGQQVEVAPDGHLADVERNRQLDHLDPTLALHPGADALQAVDRVDAHDAPTQGSAK